jgi:aspartate racemase
MHIGLIDGIGPAATEHYYRGLIERHSRSGVPLELTIVHADVRELARNVTALARQTQAEVFAGLVRRLAGAGAQLAAVTSMGGHFCIVALEPLSPLPEPATQRVVGGDLADGIDLHSVGEAL